MTPKEAGGKKQDNSKKEDEVKGTEVEDESHEAMKEETEVEDEDKGRRRVSEQAGPSMRRGIKERRGSEQAGPSLQEGVPKEDPGRGNLRDERDEDLLGNDPANAEIQDGKEAGNPSSSNHVEDLRLESIEPPTNPYCRQNPKSKNTFRYIFSTDRGALTASLVRPDRILMREETTRVKVWELLGTQITHSWAVSTMKKRTECRLA